MNLFRKKPYKTDTLDPSENTAVQKALERAMRNEPQAELKEKIRTASKSFGRGSLTKEETVTVITCLAGYIRASGNDTDILYADKAAKKLHNML